MYTVCKSTELLTLIYCGAGVPKAVNHFLGQILLKLAVNVNNGKNGIPLFILFLKLIQAKIFSIFDFQDFFNGAHFSLSETRQIKERRSL
jgi:hypothetical protein